MMEFQDYYKLLNLNKNASQDDIKKAYRKLARKYHPDVSKEANAETKFKQIKEAYEVLKDPEKRAHYDQLGQHYKQGQGFEPPPGWQQQRGAGVHSQHFDTNDFSDFFSSMFGGGGPGFRQQSRPQRGQDQTTKMDVTLLEAFNGSSRQLNLQHQTINPKTAQPELHTKTINIKIPAGIKDGQSIRVTGQASPGYNGGPAGDLYIEIHVLNDKHFTLDGKNILLNLPITPWEAALGAEIEVPTMAGKVKLKIPEGSQTGKKMRLKGRGMPGKEPGDQIVILNIEIPVITNDEQRALYYQMAKTMDFNPRANF